VAPTGSTAGISGSDGRVSNRDLGARASDAPAPARRLSASAVGILAHRNFGPYFAGNLLSNSGTWLQNVAQAILVYQLTRSAFLVGLVNFAQFSGVMLFAPWSGGAADRYDRRRLLILTQLVAVAITGGLAIVTWAGLATAPVVIGFALALGLTTAFAIPAMQSLVPSLVDRSDLGRAVAMNSVTFQLSRAIGPVMGAIIVARLGFAAAFGLNCLSYLALVTALLLVRPRRHGISAGRRPRLGESIAALRKNTRRMALFGVIVAVSLSVDPVNTLTPAFASDVYGRTETFAGFLVAAFGLGAVAAAVLVGGRPTSARRTGISMAVMGTAMTAFALTGSLVAGLVALFAAGFGFLSTVTAATTALHLEVDEAERGRTMALWSVAFLGSRPMASLVDGTIASLTTVRAATVVMALPALLGAAGVAAVLRRRRRS
jgi:MFS family permease